MKLWQIPVINIHITNTYNVHCASQANDIDNQQYYGFNWKGFWKISSQIEKTIFHGKLSAFFYFPFFLLPNLTDTRKKKTHRPVIWIVLQDSFWRKRQHMSGASYYDNWRMTYAADVQFDTLCFFSLLRIFKDSSGFLRILKNP